MSKTVQDVLAEIQSKIAVPKGRNNDFGGYRYRKAEDIISAARAAAPTLRVVSAPSPRYPPEALRAGTSGEVLVEITVAPDGSVTNARVVRATPPRVFDREALNAVRRWKFEPIDSATTTRRTLAFNPG